MGRGGCLEKQLLCKKTNLWAAPRSPPAADTGGVYGQPFLLGPGHARCPQLGSLRPARPRGLAHGQLQPGISLVDAFQALHGSPRAGPLSSDAPHSAACITPCHPRSWRDAPCGGFPRALTPAHPPGGFGRRSKPSWHPPPPFPSRSSALSHRQNGKAHARGRRARGEEGRGAASQ